MSKPTRFPAQHHQIAVEAEKRGFDQQAHVPAVSFLRALVASRTNINILELGSGLGLSTCWFLDGMDAHSTLTSVENNADFVQFIKQTLGSDKRLNLVHQDGEETIKTLQPASFDLIFADTWPGKYSLLDETLSLLKNRGVYLIDDMLPQPNWPEGHAEKAASLAQSLTTRKDLMISRMDFSTGLFYCVKQE